MSRRTRQVGLAFLALKRRRRRLRRQLCRPSDMAIPACTYPANSPMLTRLPLLSRPTSQALCSAMHGNGHALQGFGFKQRFQTANGRGATRTQEAILCFSFLLLPSRARYCSFPVFFSFILPNAAVRSCVRPFNCLDGTLSFSLILFV
jgi:hypothetical protein